MQIPAHGQVEHKSAGELVFYDKISRGQEDLVPVDYVGARTFENLGTMFLNYYQKIYLFGVLQLQLT